MEAIGREAFARRLGIVREKGEISRRGLAGLLRAPVERWGLSTRAAILRYAREQLDAAGLRDRASSKLKEVLDDLIRLGECAEVRVGYERYIAPALPRWMRTGQGAGVLLGGAAIPGEISELPEPDDNDVVRRIRVDDADHLAALRIAEIRETSLEEWLRPFGYVRHASRRMGSMLRSDELSLSRFWEQLDGALAGEGLPLGKEAHVRVVTDKQGSFFGRFDAKHCEGRWTDSPSDGVWCGCRRGYGDAHWHPIIVRVTDDERRALDLFNWDEWRWALLGRSCWIGTAERVQRLDGKVELTFRAPDQLAAAMDLLGPRHTSWSWSVLPGAPDPWTLLK